MRTNHNRRSYLMSLGTLATAGLAGCLGDEDTVDGGGTTVTDGSDEQEVYEITFHEFLPEGHPATAGMEYFVENVQEESDGRIEFEVFYGSQLGPGDEGISLVQGGTATMGSTLPGYESDLLPLSTISHIPATFPDAEVGSEVLFDLLLNTLEGLEYEPLGIKPLIGTVQPPYNLSTVDGMVTDLGGWDGLNVRSPGGLSSVSIEALGGTAVEMGGGDVYPALDSGTIDSVIIASSTIMSREIYDFVNYSTTNLHMGSFSAIHSVNLDFFNGLPEGLQDLLVDIGAEASSHQGGEVQAADDQAHEDFPDVGVEPYEVPESELDDWYSIALDAVQDAWDNQVDHEAAQDVYDEWTGAF